MQTIIKWSKEKEDGLHLDIALKPSTQPPQQLRCHAAPRIHPKSTRDEKPLRSKEMIRQKMNLQCGIGGRNCRDSTSSVTACCVEKNFSQWTSIILTDGTKSASERLTYDQAAWMTAIIFKEWLHKTFVQAVRRHLREQRLQERAVLLLDNCRAHAPATATIG